MLLHPVHHRSARFAGPAPAENTARHPGLRVWKRGERTGMVRGRLLLAAPVLVAAGGLGLLVAGHSDAAPAPGPAPSPAVAPAAEVELLDAVQYVCAGHESLATVPGAVVVDCAG